MPETRSVQDGNYLEHHELYEALKPYLAEKDSFSVLDLGCGARLIAVYSRCSCRTAGY